MTDIGDGYFDETVASSYDQEEGRMFDPAVVEPFTSDRRQHVSVWEKPA